MKLSTRGQYGTRALLDIALHQGEAPVLLRDVARRQQIPPLYLGHLISPLVGAGIIGSTRGARGGVWLARSPQEIKLSEVIQLLEGPTAPVECLNDPKFCPRFDLCVTRELWDDLKKALDRVLESVTLQGLVERQKRKEQAVEEMYYI